MPQNTRLIRSAVVLVFVIWTATPRQASADDKPKASFDERWQTVPGNGDFTCDFRPDIENSSLRDNEDFYISKPPIIRLPPLHIGRHRHTLNERLQHGEAETQLLLTALKKQRTNGGTAVIEDTAEGIFGKR